MAKLYLYVQCTGIFLGLVVGAIMFIIAFNQNTQGEFITNPIGLFWVFYMWAAAISFPFTLISLFAGNKKKPQ